MTEITHENLVAAGYRKSLNKSSMDKWDTLYEKWVRDDSGRMYAIHFRSWSVGGASLGFDAQVCCDTSTGGYAWLKMREDTIEATESRAEALGRACGSVYYDKDEEAPDA